jgi:hypothetical protein
MGHVPKTMTVVAPDEVISVPAPTTAQLTDVGGRPTSFSTMMVTGKQRRDATCGFVSGNLGNETSDWLAGSDTLAYNQSH